MQLRGRKDGEINVDRNVYGGVRWYRMHISRSRWVRNPECARREWRSATWLLNDSYYANDASLDHALIG